VTSFAVTSFLGMPGHCWRTSGAQVRFRLMNLRRSFSRWRTHFSTHSLSWRDNTGFQTNPILIAINTDRATGLGRINGQNLSFFGKYWILVISRVHHRQEGFVSAWLVYMSSFKIKLSLYLYEIVAKVLKIINSNCGAHLNSE
jgi:hypothetical protein